MLIFNHCLNFTMQKKINPLDTTADTTDCDYYPTKKHSSHNSKRAPSDFCVCVASHIKGYRE